jgi:hypothetical protein
MNSTACPQCLSPRVHRSRRRQTAERLLALLGCSMRRCRDCNSRYVRFGGSLIHMKDVERIYQRLLLTLGMAVAAVLVMLVIVWFSRSQSTPSVDTGSLVSPAGLGSTRPPITATGLNGQQQAPGEYSLIRLAGGGRLSRAASERELPTVGLSVKPMGVRHIVRWSVAIPEWRKRGGASPDRLAI